MHRVMCPYCTVHHAVKAAAASPSVTVQHSGLKACMCEQRKQCTHSVCLSRALHIIHCNRFRSGVVQSMRPFSRVALTHMSTPSCP